ncbi:LLM class flavin-dependent oxidoreductase [Streptomyces sp. ME02-6979.5a]|uniref:LLM class flavin-dependent oxidoreductase n=1 Tax=Streptomyces sp. ME02-6979.5a TaxID=462925 RepID=UPI0029B0C976|nr:LLM class flavin-dependent oxidoreductase [Streptomyces sp. ME02-6979.5a]MDX3339700.1 LLM class flavin-dependent oxidoreductase [Streptomyces sp. ME02-6979.5a]
MSKGLRVYASMQGRFPDDAYIANAVDLAATCERLGFTGALVHFNHRVPDPWLLSSLLIQQSMTFVPMIAVQPYYTSPFALAKMLATTAYLHGRRVDLNMVAGSTPGELRQVGDRLDHCARFDRMDEYLSVLMALLSGESPAPRPDPVYDYEKPEYFATRMDPELLPRIFIAGSSEEAVDLSVRHGAVAVTNPAPANLFVDGFAASVGRRTGLGVRFGLIVRETSEEAWAAARRYFPPNRAAQINVKLHGRASDSVWRKDLANLSAEETHQGVFWLGAILSGASHSPFLVGSADEVGRYFSRYLECGVSEIILASPWEEYESNAEFLAPWAVSGQGLS